MSRYFRIIVAEIVFSTFLAQILLPYSTFASSSEDAPLETPITSSSEVTISPENTTSSGASPDTMSSLSDSYSGSGTASGEVGTPPQNQEAPQNIQIQESNSFDKKTDLPQENQILVQFKTDIDTYVGQYQVDIIEQSHNLVTTDIIAENNIAVMEQKPDIVESLGNPEDTAFFADTTEKTLTESIQELNTDPRVAYAQKNFIYQIQSPNDTDFDRLWGLDNNGQSVNGTTGTPDADIDYSEAINYASGKLGTGVIVAVLDTGVSYTHPDLAGHMWDGKDCLSDTGAYMGGCIHGYDFAYDDKNPSDFHGHGTHVAGTIGAITNNGTGVTGIVPNVRIMAVKVLNDSGSATTATIIRGINFAKYNGAKVINASLGGSPELITTERNFDMLSYNAIKDFPGLFIAASGNDGVDVTQSRAYPAGFGSDTAVSSEVYVSGEYILSGSVIIPALQNIISVAASDQTDTIAWFSNYSSGTVHIAAPGTNIYSTTIVSTGILQDAIAYQNRWTKYGGDPENWSTRSIDSISGEAIDFSGALWTDTRSPYLSGAVATLYKSFTGIQSPVQSITVATWCDTPSSGNWLDYIAVGAGTGASIIGVGNIDEDINSFLGVPVEVNGYTGYYYQKKITLPFVAEGNLDLAFQWITNSNGVEGTGTTHYGCAILGNVGMSGIQNTYGYKNGTSMATPHVAGAAALAMSYAPNVSVEDVRKAVLWSTDYKAQLAGKVMYGRLNIANMLKAIENPSIKGTNVLLSGEAGAKIFVDASPKNGAISKSITVSKNPNFYGTSGILPQIKTLYTNGIISSEIESEGFLYSSLNRAEAAKLIAKVSGYSPTQCSGTLFTDVQSSLGDACGYIEALAQAGVVTTRYVNFRPNATITNAEFYKMMLLSVGKNPVTGTGYISSSFGTGEYAGYGQAIMNEGCPVYDMPMLMNPMEISYAYQTAVCIAKLKDVTDTRSFYTADDTGRVDILGLELDTTYYYYATANSLVYSTGSRFEYSSFRTPKIISQTASGIVSSSGQVLYLSGSTASGVVYSTLTTQSIILSDTGSRVQVQIPLQNLTITASGAWDGTIHAPELISTNTGIQTASGNVVVESLYTAGNPDTPLALSGNVATLSIKTTVLDGNTMKVYRADDIGLLFVEIGECVVTAGVCTFTTNHFSVFGLSLVPRVIPSLGGGGGPGGPVFVTTNSLVPSIQNLLLLPQMSTNTTHQVQSNSIEHYIASLKRQMVLKYLSEQKYNQATSSSQTADETIVKPVLQKIETIKNRGERLVSYDFVLHALETKRMNTEDLFEKKVLSTALQKVMTERLLYIQDAFKK